MKAKTKCSVDSCPDATKARGWCNSHYHKWQRHGDPLWKPPERIIKACAADGCDEIARVLELCQVHYTAQYNAKHENKARAKANRAAYRARPDIRESQAAYSRGYNARPEVKAKLAARSATPEDRERKKATAAARYANPEARAHILATAAAYRANPEHRAAGREWRLLTKYGLTQVDYDRKLAAQGGGCAICGTTERGRNQWGPIPLPVDHDHRCCPGEQTCGRCVRDILCDRCNRGISFLRDDPGLLMAAAGYLNKWQQVSEVA